MDELEKKDKRITSRLTEIVEILVSFILLISCSIVEREIGYYE